MAATLAASFSVVLATAAFAAPNAGTGTTSTNWAGHVVQTAPGQSFNFVTASWVEPAMAVKCGAPGTSPSVVTFSVGFDGYGNGTHEHAGTAMQCAPTGPPPAPVAFKETAYYETCVGFKCATVRLGPTFPLQAGDHITAAASFAAGSFTFVLHNGRTDQTYKATVAAAGTRTSAEAIVDDPVGPGVAPLLNFGKVTFSHFHAHAVGNEQGDEQSDESGNNHDGDKENHDGDNENHDGDGENTIAITMKDAAGNVRAVPGHGEDNRFTVTWKHS